LEAGVAINMYTFDWRPPHCRPASLGQAVHTRAFRFAIRIDSFCKKKSGFRFTIIGFCIMKNVFQCLWFICYL